MRILPVLFLALAVAGCAGANAAHPVAGAEAQNSARASAGARAPLPADEWWTEGGVTREKLNAMCWMKYEKGRNDLPLERRADLVNACVAEARKRYGLR